MYIEITPFHACIEILVYAIINEYIKTTSNQFIEIYEKLFNLIFDTGFIPESWVVGNIIPTYKNKGDSNDPKNFRPISLVG